MSLLGENGQLFGWSESTWLLLDQIGIVTGDILMALTIVGGVVAWFHRERLRRWFKQGVPLVDVDAEETARWDALVFTVSRPDLPKLVIRNRKPEAIGLLATEQSQTAADDIAAFARAEGIRVFGPRRIDDPDNPVEGRDEALQLIRRMREQGLDRIAVDVTGGKTPMSIGAFQAAETENCDVLYVSSDSDSHMNPVPGSLRVRCLRQAG